MRGDGYRYELVRGELRQRMPAGHDHGRLAMRVAGPLYQFVCARSLGQVYAAETGFELAVDQVRAPDVSFVAQARLDRAGDVVGFWPGAPDLAVEVLSPSDRYADVEEKVVDWLEAGTRMVVLVNPRRRTVTVFRSLAEMCILTEADALEGADVVPGWSLPVADIFG